MSVVKSLFAPIQVSSLITQRLMLWRCQA